MTRGGYGEVKERDPIRIFYVSVGVLLCLFIPIIIFIAVKSPTQPKEKFQTGYFQHPNEIENFQSKKKTVSWK